MKRLSFRSLKPSFLLLIFSVIVPMAATAESKLSIGTPLEPPHLDPTRSAAAAIDEVLYANVFEGLTGINADGAVVPRLATSWKASSDAKEFTFKLVKGVKFHDGSKFTAADAVYSFNAASADKSENAQKRVFSNFVSVKALDDFTLQIKLREARSNLPWLLAQGDAVIVSEASAAKNKTEPIGTGPFTFERWRKGDSIRLVRNKSYWGSPASFDQVDFRFISDPGAAFNALASGDLDAFANFPAPELVADLEKDGRFSVVIGNTEGETILAMNNQKKPLDDKRVRQAITLAINKQDIIDGAMSGFGVQIGSHFSPSAAGYVNLTDALAYDREKAKKLLAQAGYENGFTLTLKLPPPAYARRGGEIIASMLAKVGIKAEIEPVEWAQWLDKVFSAKDYDLTIVSHTEPMDIEIYSRPGYYFNYTSQDFNSIISSFYAAPDEATRLKKLAEAQRLLSDDAVNVYLFMLPKIGVWRTELKGLWKNSPIQANDVTRAYWQK